MQFQLKKSFITGVFVIVPVVISVALLIWFFQKVDLFFSPPIDGILKLLVGYDAHIPGTGLLTGLLIIFLVGLFARNVVGARVLSMLDAFSNRIPGYRTIYSTIKQMTDAFSPDNTRSFKEVMLVEYPKEGSFAIAFRTATVEMEGARLAVVFVPTNHLYLGEVLLVPEERVQRLDLTIEQAVRILVSGGTAAPRQLRPFAPPGGADAPPREPVLG